MVYMLYRNVKKHKLIFYGLKENQLKKQMLRQVIIASTTSGVLQILKNCNVKGDYSTVVNFLVMPWAFLLGAVPSGAITATVFKLAPTILEKSDLVSLGIGVTTSIVISLLQSKH